MKLKKGLISDFPTLGKSKNWIVCPSVQCWWQWWTGIYTNGAFRLAVQHRVKRKVWLGPNGILFLSTFTMTSFFKIRRHTLKMMSLFVSIYLCEQLFSKMNFEKYKFWSTLIDIHLPNSLKMSFSNIKTFSL